MAMNSDAPKHGSSGGGELEKRMTAVEGRLGAIEKTMVTTEVFERELGAVRGEIGAVRDEMHTEFGAVRDEMHTEFGAVRDEMHTQFGALRDEMHVGLAAVRHEMLAAFGAMRVEIAKLPFELVKWLIALSGIAAAIATAVYNIWFR
ncbi:MAG TPA: hypothetical protein VLI71_15185 [Gammaproteobacteria bacterium]|nr:hypothetical protein [Gammaproteobacteria bacterium]